MTHTEDTLRVLSDFERNKILAGIIHGEEWWHKHEKVVFINRLMPTDSGGFETRKAPVNYCKTPNDIMPLAFEHKIGVEFIDGFGWTASHAYDLTSASCYDNPLRAVVMCLILHLQECKA